MQTGINSSILYHFIGINFGFVIYEAAISFFGDIKINTEIKSWDTLQAGMKIFGVKNCIPSWPQTRIFLTALQ